jgi:hypothetical protein
VVELRCCHYSLVDSKVGIVDYWSAKEGVSSAILRVRMRHRQARNRRNISQEVSNSMRLMSAGFCGYLAPDIVEAIAEGRQPRCMTVRCVARHRHERHGVH